MYVTTMCFPEIHVLLKTFSAHPWCHCHQLSVRGYKYECCRRGSHSLSSTSVVSTSSSSHSSCPKMQEAAKPKPARRPKLSRSRGTSASTTSLHLQEEARGPVQPDYSPNQAILSESPDFWGVVAFVWEREPHKHFSVSCKDLIKLSDDFLWNLDTLEKRLERRTWNMYTDHPNEAVSYFARIRPGLDFDFLVEMACSLNKLFSQMTAAAGEVPVNCILAAMCKNFHVDVADENYMKYGGYGSSDVTSADEKTQVLGPDEGKGVTPTYETTAILIPDKGEGDTPTYETTAILSPDKGKGEGDTAVEVPASQTADGIPVMTLDQAILLDSATINGADVVTIVQADSVSKEGKIILQKLTDAVFAMKEEFTKSGQAVRNMDATIKETRKKHEENFEKIFVSLRKLVNPDNVEDSSRNKGQVATNKGKKIVDLRSQLPFKSQEDMNKFFKSDSDLKHREDCLKTHLVSSIDGSKPAGDVIIRALNVTMTHDLMARLKWLPSREASHLLLAPMEFRDFFEEKFLNTFFDGSQSKVRKGVDVIEDYFNSIRDKNKKKKGSVTPAKQLPKTKKKKN